VTAEAAALARHRLKRAHAALAEADLLPNQEAWPGAINRYYYAAFHTARALLATTGLDSARHAGVIALFQQQFVKTGMVAADIARALPRSFEKRLSSDYTDFVDPAPDDSRRVAREVHAFVDACTELLGRLSTEREGGESADGPPAPANPR